METLSDKRLGTMNTESNPSEDMQIVYSEGIVKEFIHMLKMFEWNRNDDLYEQTCSFFDYLDKLAGEKLNGK